MPQPLLTVTELRQLDKRTLRDMRDRAENERVQLMHELATLSLQPSDADGTAPRTVVSERAHLAADIHGCALLAKRCTEAMISKKEREP